MKTLLLITAFVASTAASAWTQASEAPVTDGQRGDSNQSEDSAPASPTTPWLPVAINGETGGLRFLSEGVTNLLSGGLTFGSSYDDNAYSDNSRRVGNVSYIVSPNLAIQEIRPRTMLTFNYSPGFTANQRLSQRYDYAHNLDFNLQYRITEHLTARLKNDFVKQTTAFDRINNNAGTAPLTPLQQQNDSIITPLADRMANLSSLDLIYAISNSTLVGTTGSFNFLQYRNATSGSRVHLSDSQSVGGDAFAQHRLAGNNWLGVTYSYRKIATSGQITEGSKIHSIQLFYTFAPSSHTTLSLFVGPEHIMTSDQFDIVLLIFVIPVTERKENWNVAGGATFGWQGRRNSLQAKFIRQTSDGGGLTGAVRTSSGSFSVRRQLTSRMSGDVGFAYGANDAIGPAFNTSISSISALAGWQHSLGDNFSIGFSYARDHQNIRGAANSALPPSLADHNRFWASVSYHFARPLGR